LKSSPEKPRAKAIWRDWKAWRPTAGSTCTLKIFSGVWWATCSISMPPSVEATMTGKDVARSRRMAR